MEGKIHLTEKDIENAVSYVPLAMKEEFVEYCSTGCLQRVSINLGEYEEAEMPYMFKEDTFLRSRYMITALVVLYLGWPIEKVQREEGNLWLMEQAEYDRFAMSHILNQLERMKGKAEIRDKIFDLLRDYRDLEKRLSTAIYGNLTVMNDAANRIFLKLAMDVSKESLEAHKQAVEKVQKQLEEIRNGKEDGEMEG